MRTPRNLIWPDGVPWRRPHRSCAQPRYYPVRYGGAPRAWESGCPLRR